MGIVALVLALVGLALSLWGAIWLWFGLDPDNDRYNDDGMLYPGQQQSKVLPRYISDSRKPTLLVAIGGGIQVLAGIVALFDAVS